MQHLNDTNWFCSQSLKIIRLYLYGREQAFIPQLPFALYSNIKWEKHKVQWFSTWYLATSSTTSFALVSCLIYFLSYSGFIHFNLSDREFIKSTILKMCCMKIVATKEILYKIFIIFSIVFFSRAAHVSWYFIMCTRMQNSPTCESTSTFSSYFTLSFVLVPSKCHSKTKRTWLEILFYMNL